MKSDSSDGSHRQSMSLPNENNRVGFFTFRCYRGAMDTNSYMNFCSIPRDDRLYKGSFADSMRALGWRGRNWWNSTTRAALASVISSGGCRRRSMVSERSVQTNSFLFCDEKSVFGLPFLFRVVGNFRNCSIS
jgi:hypothetical protein